MQNLFDIELDMLMRKVLVEHEEAFDPKAWEKMEKKLDTLPPPRSYFFNFRYLLVFFSIFSTGLFSYLYFSSLSHSEKISTIPQANSPTNRRIAYPFEDDAKESVSLSFTFNNTIESSLTERNNKEAEYVMHDSHAGPINANPPSPPYLSKQEPLAKKGQPSAFAAEQNNSLDNSILSGRQRTSLDQKDNNNVRSLPVEENYKSTHYVDETDKGSGSHRATVGSKFPFISIIKPSFPYSEIILKQMAMVRSEHKKSDSPDAAVGKKAGHQGLSIFFSISPDFNALKPGGSYQAGLFAGVGIAYRFNKRWAISMGLLGGTKNYTGTEGYNATKFNYTANGSLEKVDASCKIIDIPINLRYNLLIKPQYVIFVSSGLSSYFMLEEDYAFTTTYYGNSYVNEESYKNENNHYLGILNLSAGYERDISTHFSWQIEPFVKVPLAEVGQGDVKLFSVGGLISLRYKLNRQR